MRVCYRFYPLSETPDDDGQYRLRAFIDSTLNVPVGTEELDGTLDQIAESLLGQASRWRENKADMKTDVNGKLCIAIEVIEIEEVRRFLLSRQDPLFRYSWHTGGFNRL